MLISMSYRINYYVVFKKNQENIIFHCKNMFHIDTYETLATRWLPP